MIIYEVTIQLSPVIYEEFRIWLDGHVQEMLTIAGFLRADVEVCEGVDLKEICVRYGVENEMCLEDYFSHHAERMRGRGLERFGGQFSISRRILTV